MSSQDNEILNYFDDNSQDERGTPFIPVRPDNGSDSWTRFFCGLLAGITGGALIPLGAWLGGALIFVGYGLVAHTLSGSSRRTVRSICFGFLIASLIGATILAGACFSPETLHAVVNFFGRHNAIFLGTVAMPWVIAVIKFFYSKRNSRTGPSRKGRFLMRRPRQPKLAR